jgi:alpha-1,2-glucosyltransferase
VKSFLGHLRTAKGMLLILIAALSIAAIVHFNTIVHPYLLADNRHYTFYIWNRIYSRNLYFRFLMIPAYIFGLYNICASLRGSIAFKIFFIISIFLTFCLQSLVEVRYFLIPFLVLRLHQNDLKKKWSAAELLVNLVINYLTFRVFFSVETVWPEFDEPQRIIW